jgi:hypothetical protein
MPRRGYAIAPVWGGAAIAACQYTSRDQIPASVDAVTGVRIGEVRTTFLAGDILQRLQHPIVWPNKTGPMR